MANVSLLISAQIDSTGTAIPVSLLELQLISGTRLFFSNASITAPTLLSQFDGGGQTSSAFSASLLEPPTFPVTCDLVTQTGTASIENISGDSVNRTTTQLFSAQDLWGALFYFRIWDPALEWARFTQIGTVADAELDETQMELTLTSWLNFSKITAPDCQINNNCQNVFGSQQCGSTSATNCLNCYGNCSQLNRFKGLITQWNSGVYTISTNSGIAQPVPSLILNSRMPG